MTPNQVQTLVTIAFTLEAISDKPGCTTRFVDLPGKPLSDFLIAGINAGHAFRRLAEDYQERGVQTIFHRYVEALKASDDYKGPKTVNFGLLEMMFMTVAARLRTQSGEEALAYIPTMLKEAGSEDVHDMLDARLVAWRTSTTPEKSAFPDQEYRDCVSPWAYHVQHHAAHPPSFSGYQWAEEIFNGFPIARRFLQGMPGEVEPMLAWIHQEYPKVVSEFEGVKLGIIADMCAAAIFLRLSDVKQG